MRNSLVHQIGRNIADHRLWTAGEGVAIAVSGGLDSMVLLDLLVATQRWHGGRLSVVTVDHGLRPGSADDAAFVAGRCAQIGLPAAILRVSLPAQADEAAAREARYAAIEGHSGDLIALGHHQRDQAETVLIQLLRGTGLAGLSAMSWRSDRRVRPLLDVPHAALRAYADERGLEWREDPTNLDGRFLRNRVRSEVLPLLESIRPGATASIARSARVIAVDQAYLDAVFAERPALATPPIPRDALREAPAPIARLAIRRAFPGLSQAHVDQILAAVARGDGVIDVPGGRIAVDDTVRRLPP